MMKMTTSVQTPKLVEAAKAIVEYKGNPLDTNANVWHMIPRDLILALANAIKNEPDWELIYEATKHMRDLNITRAERAEDKNKIILKHLEKILQEQNVIKQETIPLCPTCHQPNPEGIEKIERFGFMHSRVDCQGPVTSCSGWREAAEMLINRAIDRDDSLGADGEFKLVRAERIDALRTALATEPDWKKRLGEAQVDFLDMKARAELAERDQSLAWRTAQAQKERAVKAERERDEAVASAKLNKRALDGAWAITQRAQNGEEAWEKHLDTVTRERDTFASDCRERDDRIARLVEGEKALQERLDTALCLLRQWNSGWIVGKEYTTLKSDTASLLAEPAPEKAGASMATDSGKGTEEEEA